MHHRTKIVLVGSFATLIAKILSFFSQVFILFLFSRYLSGEEFGLFSILSSVSLLVGMLDFGITGHGLRNKLATMNSNREEKKLFFSVFTLSLLFFFLFSLVALLLVPQVPWNKVFAKSNLTNISLPLLISCLFTFSRAAFVINTNGFYAYQKAHTRSLFEIAETFLLCLMSLMGILCKLSFIPLTALYYGAFFFGPFLSFFGFLRWKKWKPVKMPLKEMLHLSKPLLSTSLYFWLYHTCSLAFFSLQPFLIGHLVNLEEAGDFCIAQKCFTLFLGIHFTLLVPLWSAFTHAAGALDWGWIGQTLRKALLFTLLLFSLGLPLMLLLFSPLTYLWTGKSLALSSSVYLLALLTLLFAFINCLSVFLSGLGRIKAQAHCIFFGLAIHLAITLTFRTPSSMLLSAIFSLLPLLLSNITETKNLFSQAKVLPSPP